MKVRIRPIFAWYDFWIGVFFDRGNRRAYVFPLPMLGFKVMTGHASGCPTLASGCHCGWDRD